MRVRRVKTPDPPPYPEEINVTVYGHAIPKARARVVGTRRNKKTKDGEDIKPHTFTPQTTVEWEASIYGQTLASRPPFPYEGPVQLGVLFFKRMPKAIANSKYKRALAMEHKLMPAGARDDYDNMIKAVKDALNGLYWLDDGQVVQYIPVNGMHPGKYYSDVPRVEIRVRFLPQE
jgi:Holliday junction resolvase RusA-like endonuclease